MSTPDFSGSGRPGRHGPRHGGRASDDRPGSNGYDREDGYPRQDAYRRSDDYGQPGRAASRRDGYAASQGGRRSPGDPQSGRGGQRESDRYGLGDRRSRRDGYDRRPADSGRDAYQSADGYGQDGGARRRDGYGRRDGLAGRSGPDRGGQGRGGPGPGGSYGPGSGGGYEPGDGYGTVDGYGHGDGYGYGSDDGYESEEHAGGGRLLGFGRGGGGRRGGGNGGGGDGNGDGGKRGRAPKPKGNWWRHWTWKKVVAVVLGACGGLVLIAAIVIGVAYTNTSIPTDVSALALQQASTVYFSDGKTVVGTFGTTNRQVLNSNQIPAQLKNAVLAAEDRNFYNEGGVSPTGIIRAAYDDLTSSGSSLQGGSTITQQFVRNYYANIGSQQTISRKIKEIFVASKLAGAKSKDWILTQYLNTIYFGDGAYGVGAAAETFFNEPASKLTVSQDAMIAAMLNAPGQFDPTPGSAGYKPLVARWHYVLLGMATMGKLTQQQAVTQTFPKITSDQAIASGWTGYNGYIMQDVRAELESTYHYSLAQIDNDGLRIVTTFSKPMMNALYATVSQNEKLMREGGRALPSYAHIGAVLEQPGTGAIVAMYSGPSYSQSARECKIDFCNVDMALGNREQVGSSFKPYVLAAARAQGMNVKSSILDGSSPLCVPGDQYPTQYAVPSPSGQAGCPTTPYGWHAFTNDAGDSGTGGPQSVVYATAASLNTAYTDLAHRVGLQNITTMAKSFGVNTASYPGGSGLQTQTTQGEVGIALGTASLTVGEQANTFAALANDGQYVTPHVIAQITQGTNLIRAHVVHRAALTPDEASDVDYALSFDTYTGYGTGGAAGMTDGRPIIGKTGTTSSEQSAFFLGAIPQYSLAVGMFTNNQSGNTGGETLNGVGGLPGYGGDWPAKIWHSFAEGEFAKLPVEQFPTPDFGGTSWNLVGAGSSLTKPKPHPSPTVHPTPTPTGTCSPSPLQPTCGSPPPTSPPPTSPPPTSPPPTCTPGLRCHTRPPTPPFSGDGSNNGNRASTSLAPDPSPSPRPARSG